MKNMVKKMRNRKGFTLMEMLIVVAIIAVLAIIAIPTFTSALTKAKSGTDLANIRSGYAAAQVGAITEEYADGATLYLQKDGSVDTATTNAYTTEGTSAKVTGTSVGGKFDVAETAATGKVAWAKGNKIKYTIGEENGVLFVETITVE